MRTDIFWYCEFRQPAVKNRQDPWSKDSKTRHEDFLLKNVSISVETAYWSLFE